jgi:hypothetical protein
MKGSKSAVIFTLCALLFTCAACSLFSFSQSTPTSIESPTQIITSPNESTETITRDYEWNYKRRDWTWNLSIPKSLYDYYKERPRAQTADYSIYVTHPGDDQYIQLLADKIKKAATDAKYSEKDTINLAISFVQSLPYATDDVTTAYDEYPRYPIETLADSEGDCEDTAILMAALLDAMGYDVVLIAPPNHMAVGILGEAGMSGTYWEHNGGKYYYIETTGSNWEVGELPPEYIGKTAHIYDIIPVPILTHDWKSESSRDKLTLTVTVENVGTAAADGVYVSAGFDAGNDMLWNTKESASFDLAPDQSFVIHMELTIPKDEYTRLCVQIVYNNYSADQSYSEWFDT